LKELKESETHHSVGENQTFTKIKEIPKALLALLRNPTFFFLNLAGAAEGLVVSGFAVFLPKLIENQFSMTAVMAAMYMGLITVPGGGGGTFLGGYLVKKLNLSCAGIIKLCLFAAIMAAGFTLCFFLWCPNLQFAGVTAPYFPQVAENWKNMGQNNLHHICNTKCSCTSSGYEPICGGDGVMYYSPCHAGCLKEINLDANKVYQDCVCIQKGNYTEGIYENYDAVNTMCDSTCTHLVTFVVLCFFAMIATFMSTMPALSATLRYLLLL
jgi:solute carrier organic anion transporter family, member 4A